MSEPKRQLVTRHSQWATVWTHSWTKTLFSLHHGEFADILNLGSQWQWAWISSAVAFNLGDLSFESCTPVETKQLGLANMDFPCFPLLPHEKNQMPVISFRKASGMGEMRVERTCLTYMSWCAPLFLYFIHISSFLLLHAFLILKLHHWTYLKGIHVLHQQGFLISCKEYVKVFPPTPLYTALVQLS